MFEAESSSAGPEKSSDSSAGVWMNPGAMVLVSPAGAPPACSLGKVNYCVVEWIGREHGWAAALL